MIFVFGLLFIVVAFACDVELQQRCVIDSGLCTFNNCACFDTVRSCLESQSDCSDANALFETVADLKRQQCTKFNGVCDQDALDDCTKDYTCKDADQTCDCFTKREACYLVHPDCDNDSPLNNIENAKGLLNCPENKYCNSTDVDKAITCAKAATACKNAQTRTQQCGCLNARVANCFSQMTLPCQTFAADEVAKYQGTDCLNTTTTTGCSPDVANACLTALNSAECAAGKETSCDCLKKRSKCVSDNAANCQTTTQYLKSINALIHKKCTAVVTTSTDGSTITTNVGDTTTAKVTDTTKEGETTQAAATTTTTASAVATTKSTASSMIISISAVALMIVSILN